MSRYPMNGTLELTLRCNLRCKMCMFRREDTQLMQELTAAQWIDLADQLAKAGTLSLLLTGGEPLMRKDFAEIYAGIYPKGFLLTLYTNATLVTDRVMETLRAMPPHRIGVTLYGTCNEDYEAICGMPNGFDKAMEGIEKLRTLPSALELRFTPTCDTIEKTEVLDKLVYDRFGIHPILSSRVFKAVRGGCMHPETCRPTPQQTVDIIHRQMQARLRNLIPEQFKEHVKLEIFDRCEDAPQSQTLLGCSAGMKNFTITYDGKLLGCQLLDTFQTDALHEGFLPAWERFPETVKLPAHPCRDCEYLDACTICPAVAMAETGSLTGVPSYICEITKLTEKRKEEFCCEKDI